MSINHLIITLHFELHALKFLNMNALRFFLKKIKENKKTF